MTITGAAFLGVLGWSFTEYAMHNWYGHLANGSNEFSREHLRHHAQTHYFAPAWKKVVGSIITVTVLCAVSTALVELAVAAAFSVSYTLAGLGYEWLHYVSHFHPPRTQYGRWVRRHHFSHHFNNPRYNHGVTSPLWDHVFGTYRRVDDVRVPAKRAMPWLVDPASQRIYPEYQNEYTLMRPRHSVGA